MSVENCHAKIEEGKKIAEAHGFSFGVQLHNSITQELYDEIMKERDGMELSMHSPLFAEHFINLASSDFAAAQQLCLDNAARLAKIGSKILFFHGLFLTDQPIVHDMKNYRKAMAAGIGDRFRLHGSFVMNPEIFESELYQNYKKTFRVNLARIQELFPDLDVAMENDFVGMGSGLQRPQEIHELLDTIWFDLGHFWCSSLLHGFDYYAECERIIAEKKIVGIHLNHNFMTKDTPKDKISDSHGHIYQPSAQELAPIVQHLVAKGVDRFTLEIIDGDAEDMKTFFSWL